MPAERILIKIPGSTSNFGSGFDTLGMAVNLYQTIHLEYRNINGVQIVTREGHASSKVQSMVDETAQAFFDAAAIEPFGCEVRLGGNLPVGKGLGASGALRAGLIAGLSHLSGRPANLQWVLDLATEIEHHPDNVSPALFGGFTTSSIVDGEVRCIHVPVNEDLKFVTAIPDFDMDTEEARRLIPSQFPKSDVVHALNRAAMISAAFITGKYQMLRGLFDDRFHQPYRQRMLPQLGSVIQAAEKAGAIGGWLSGAGSGIMCMTLENEQGISAAMKELLPNCTMHVLRAENQGIRIAEM